MLTRLLSEISYRARALFRRDDMERELDAEVRFHLERETDKLVAKGLTRDEAQRQARAAFGGVERIKDDTRDARGTAAFESFAQDLRYAVRGLRMRPAFTAGVVVTLGLGIGANASMFDVVDRLLFRAPPMLRDQATVHRLYRSWLEDGRPRIDRNLSFPSFLDLRKSLLPAFSEVAAFQTVNAAIGEGAEVREMRITAASANYFSFFNVRPALGRFYAAAEDTLPSGAPVIVLGYGYWQSQYGGRDVIGEKVRVGQLIATIIGVAPQDFVGMSDQGVPVAFVPITTYAFARRGAAFPTMYSWSWLEMIARRRPGVSHEAASSAVASAFVGSWRNAQSLNARWGSPEDSRVTGQISPVQMGRGPHAGPEARVAVWVSGVALIVLLIACANVANLMLARAVSRRREMAMRLALGVSRARLVRQLITESALLAAVGGVVGVIVAQWGGAMLRALFLPPELGSTVLTDPRTLLFALLSTLAAALLTGVVPAINAGRGDLITALKAGEREGGQQRARLRRSLLVVQATLSVLLLVGAGLFVRSLSNARGLRLGYDTRQVLLAEANMRGVQLSDAQTLDLMQRFLAAAQAAPTVEHAAMAASIPFYSNESRGLFVPGVDSVRLLGRFLVQITTADYFATMGTRVVRGRALDDTDREGSQQVIVVSDGMARALWPNQDAIGKCIRINAADAPCRTVVGVVEDIKLRSLTDAREFTYYLPAAQFEPTMANVLVARVNGDAESQVPALRAQLQALLPSPAYVNVMPLSAAVDPNYRAWEFGATMFAAFGGLALVLAAIGLYSLIAYDVAQRTRELSVRIALGASSGSVVRMVVARGLGLVGIGVAAGLTIAAVAAPKLQSMMFNTDARDPLIFGAVAAVLLLIGFAATASPASRAARVDPAQVLRGD
jgi:putative ABC transport system permease protein